MRSLRPLTWNLLGLGVGDRLVAAAGLEIKLELELALVEGLPGRLAPALAFFQNLADPLFRVAQALGLVELGLTGLA